MSQRFEKVKEEFLALLPPTIFFFIALHIVALIRSLMTKGTGIAPVVHDVDCGRGADPRQVGAARRHAAGHQSLSGQAARLQHRLEDRDLPV